MLLSILDDSDSGKVRKSIIIVAALLLLVSNYDIQLNIPDFFLSSDKSELLIEHKIILNSLIAIQIYLIIKLIPSWYVDYSLFKKDWILGQYAGENELSEAKKEIEEFIDYCEKHSINENFISNEDIDNVKQMEQICKNFKKDLSEMKLEKLEVIISTDEIYKKYHELLQVIIDIDNFYAEYPERKLLSSEVSDKLRAAISEIRNIGKLLHEADNTTKHRVRAYEKGIEHVNAQAGTLAQISSHYGKEAGNASSRVYQLQNNLVKTKDFIESFPSSTFYNAINLSKDYLRLGRTLRKIEVIVFNLIVPLVIGGYSIIHAYA